MSRAGRTHEAPLSRNEWDQRWLRHYNLYRNNEGHRHEAAKKYADEVMRRRHGSRPDGPPTAMGLGWRIFWLLKVKKMDWKKMLYGGVAAFIGGAGAALGVAAEGGITANEWGMIVGAGFAALALYLKEPNKTGFAHPVRKQR